jgi:septal ring factor EnvC (AmiA/AmiB activator)
MSPSPQELRKALDEQEVKIAHLHATHTEDVAKLNTAQLQLAESTQKMFALQENMNMRSREHAAQIEELTQVCAPYTYIAVHLSFVVESSTTREGT